MGVSVSTAHPISRAGNNTSFERCISLKLITPSLVNDTMLFVSSSTAGTSFIFGRTDRAGESVPMPSRSTCQGLAWELPAAVRGNQSEVNGSLGSGSVLLKS